MPNKTNVLLITSDQQHWDTLGFRNPEIKTPNLDRLAARGTCFNRAYTVNPTCTPTRASILTGTYPSQHGAWSLGTKLPETVPVVGDYLQKAGVRTALVGKAHFQQILSTKAYPSLESNPLQQDLEYWRKFNGPFYGFEHVELARNHADEFHVGQHYALWMESKGFKNWKDCFWAPAGHAPPQRWKWNLPEEVHYNAWIAERTNDLMEQYVARDESFFLWASFPDPHPPYLVSEPWDTMYDPDKITVPAMHPGEHEQNPPHFQMTQEQDPDISGYQEKDGHACHGLGSHLHDRKKLAKDIAVYYGMVSMMDKYIGKILDKLDALGLTETTLIVFTTDHGHFFGQHGLVAKGAFHYEDMIKVPFLVSMPGTVPQNKQSDSLQSLVDLAPTFLDVCGIDIPRTMTGISQKDVWFGKRETIRDHVIIENRHQPTTLFHRTYVDSRYKLTVYYGRTYGELFDLETDPGEIHNLWDDPGQKDLKAGLLLKFIHAELGKEPLWMPRVSAA